MRDSEKYLDDLSSRYYNPALVGKFRSVRRAYKRGHVRLGIEIPHRPYNNRKSTKGRKQTIEKRKMYELFRGR